MHAQGNSTVISFTDRGLISEETETYRLTICTVGHDMDCLHPFQRNTT